MIQRLGLGTAHFGTAYAGHAPVPLDAIEKILAWCADHHLLFIDTSPAYGKSERSIGEVIRHLGSNPFQIASKIRRLPPPLLHQGKKNIKAFLKESIETTLNNLGISYLHIWQLSQSFSDVSRLDTFWTIIEELQCEGYFKTFGISVYEPHEAEEALIHHREIINAIQFPLNLFNQQFSPLLPLFRSANWEMIIRSIFLRGVIWRHPQELPSYFKALVPKLEKLHALAETQRTSLSDICFSHAFSCTHSGRILIGVRNVEELQMNVSTIDRVTSHPLHLPFESFACDDLHLIDPRFWPQEQTDLRKNR